MPAKKPPKTTFGQHVYALRTARGFTQVDLAKALGTTQRAISYYENQAECPPSSVLVALARVLRVTADELLGIKPVKLAHEDREKRRLWKRFRKMASLPERDQRAVVRLINSLASSNGRAEGRQ